MRNNVPFDIAFSLSPSERLAWVIVLGELEGHTWDWPTQKWVLTPTAPDP